jgi:hypothetical protein
MAQPKISRPPRSSIGSLSWEGWLSLVLLERSSQCWVVLLSNPAFDRYVALPVYILSRKRGMPFNQRLLRSEPFSCDRWQSVELQPCGKRLGPILNLKENMILCQPKMTSSLSYHEACTLCFCEQPKAQTFDHSCHGEMGRQLLRCRICAFQ